MSVKQIAILVCIVLGFITVFAFSFNKWGVTEASIICLVLIAFFYKKIVRVFQEDEQER